MSVSGQGGCLGLGVGSIEQFCHQSYYPILMWPWQITHRAFGCPTYQTSSILSTKCWWEGKLWGVKMVHGEKRPQTGGEEEWGGVRGKGSPKVSLAFHSWEGEHHVPA